jgi:hypothetical protein
MYFIIALILFIGSITSLPERIKHWYRAKGPQVQFTPVGYSSAPADPITNDFLQSYLIAVLTRSHPHIGRAGPVCPFVHRALEKEKIAVAVVPTTSQKEIQSAVLQAKASFMKERVPGDLHQTKILLFPSFQDGKVIDHIQRTLKKCFVRDGLMIGEFHRDNETPALHNPEFKPLRTEVPALAIRSIVPGDLLFLTLSSYSWWMQLQLLASYLRTFGNDSKHEKLHYKAWRSLAVTSLKLFAVNLTFCAVFGVAGWWGYWHRC